jgi:CheY-like chemotaxis protein
MQLKDASVLIVDDEVGLRRLFEKWFAREGCRVVTAANGAEALDVLKVNHVDLIVTDIAMPKVNGIDLVKRIAKRHDYFPKIIFVSGFADIDERECGHLGIEFKLMKPFPRKALIAAARTSLLSRAQLWQDLPGAIPKRVLEAVFESLRHAQDRGLVAFGHGGVCVRSPFPAQAGEMVGLNIEFTADHHALIGRGIVRWAVRHEEQIGIETIYVDDANRAWISAPSDVSIYLRGFP